ncbi:MAG: hypothetical protein ACKOET_03190 [Verrucomicrobiota bacterium]
MDWPHVHLALNHLPVVGLPVLLGLLTVALGRGDRWWTRLLLGALAALGLASIGIQFTGDLARQSLARWPGLDDSLVTRHEQAADQATTALFLGLLACVAGGWMSRGQRPIPRVAALGTLALLAVACGLLVRAAHTGGQIRHPEIRPGYAPPAAQR